MRVFWAGGLVLRNKCIVLYCIDHLHPYKIEVCLNRYYKYSSLLLTLLK